MFQQVNPASMPGIGSSTYARGRAIWLGLAGVQYLPVGGIINSSLSRDPDNTETGGNETEPNQGSGTGSNIPQPPNATQSYPGVLRAGLLMGKITTGGLYRPSIIGVIPGAISAAAHTTLTLTAQAAVEVQRLLTLAGANVTLTVTGWNTVVSSGSVTSESVTAVSVAGAVLTISSWTPASSGAYAAGAFLGAADGSQVPITFVDEQFGLNVVDGAGNSVQMNPVVTGGAAVYGVPFPRLPIAGGVVNVANIVNYPGTTNTGYSNLQTWIKSNLNTAGVSGTSGGGKFQFSDTY